MYHIGEVVTNVIDTRPLERLNEHFSQLVIGANKVNNLTHLYYVESPIFGVGV